MKELDSNLWDDFSDNSDNAPETHYKLNKEDLSIIDKLDNDRIEFEWMIDCMWMDMYYLEEELVLDQEEEKVEEEGVDLKHETAVITPDLIEKSK